MFIMYTFKVQTGDKTVESPVMGTGDITLLQKLFPKNPIWKCNKTNLGNQMFPTVEEMKSLYDDLAKHFARKEVSPKQFQTGNFTGSFAIVSTERTLFQDLIGFCEKELGFKRPAKLKTAMARKEVQYLHEKTSAEERAKSEALSVFKKLPLLKKPKSQVLIRRLTQKLAEYNERLARTSRHPDLAFMVEPEYRDTKYKIEVLSALLALKDGESLNFGAMMVAAMEKRKEYFHPDEYYGACAIIAHYAGSPFKGSDVRKELPK